MKTQIIQLNQNEDHISVREKMSWSQAGRILLIWPNYGHVLNRQLDLQLVMRHANSLGAQLALVTDDRQVGYYAKQLGIPVFPDARSAQETEWKNEPPRAIKTQNTPSPINFDKLKETIHPKTSGWMERRTTRLICLSVVALALFALGFLILPGAKIILAPHVLNQTMLFDLIADPTTKVVNYATGSLPTYRQDVIVEGSATAPVTSTVTIPDKFATGELQFTNTTDHTISIPAGTIVSTLGDDPIQFIITSSDDVRIDPDTSITLATQAMKPGLSGNLPSDQLVVLEGELSQYLTVTNPAPMSGGTESDVPAPSEQDLSGLRQRLLSQVMQRAQDEMQSTLPDDDFLITPTISNVETITETFFPAIGEPGHELELSLRIRVQAQEISKASLSNLVNPIMDANTPQGYSYQMDSLKITPQGSPVLDPDGKIYWSVQATRQLQADIPAQRVMELIRGSNPAQAKALLAAELPLAGQAQIILMPKWWPLLPLLPMRIELVLNEKQ